MEEKKSEKSNISRTSDIDDLKSRIEVLKKHRDKNKTDKSMLRCLLRKQAKLIKLVKYKS